jgi:aminopeptidase N
MKLFLLYILVLIPALSLTGKDGYRRNPAMDVINYSFSVSISDTSDTIYGKTAITISFRDTVSVIEFDLRNIKPDGKGMIVDSLYFNDGEISWKHRGDRIIINRSRPFGRDSEGILKIVYHGIPADGLIISNNKYHDRTFFSDHWPDRAGNYLPCVDHPYDKATVEFIITAPSHYEVVASGYLAEERHIEGDRKQSHWKEEVPIAVKVMAFGAAEFDIQLAGKPENIPVWSYVFRENGREGFYDYSIAVRPLTFFSQLIGTYPYEKLANVQSKTIFGGLENAGCIFYSERSVTGKGNAERLMAHEIAHQWFGNSVTENDWHHVWLSEGFATYLTSVYSGMTYGTEQLKESMKSARELVIKHYLRTPGPVIDTTVTDFLKLLNANSYQKGAWVLHMLRQDLGEEDFWKGMRLYYGRFRNGNAITNDFVNVMEEVSGKDLDAFFNQWLYITDMPELKITQRLSRKKDAAEIKIEQTQEALFSFPLELLINSQSGTISKQLRITERVTTFPVVAGKNYKIEVDPEVKLLFREVK